MTDKDRADLLYNALGDCAAANSELTIATIWSFLEDNTTRLPNAPLFPERIRDDAKFWASLAGPHELEAYLVASTAALETSPLPEKQLKRLAAMCWRRMCGDSRAAYKKWISQDE